MDRRSLLKGIVATGGAAALVKPGTAEAREKKQAPKDAVGLLYDSTKCIGCKACVVGCREANGLAPQAKDGLHDQQLQLDGQTKTVIKLYQEKDEAGQVTRSAFMKQQCMQCIDPGCVSACMLGSLQKREYGIVTYDKDLCVGCRYCQIACPFQVPAFEWFSATPEIVKCELCVHRLKEGKQPGCTEACPREAVIFGTREELLQTAHARIAAEPEKYLEKVYGEFDAGGTQVLYLTSKDVPFEKLGLPNLGTDGAPHLSESVHHGVYQGFITPIAVYGVVAFVIARNKKKEEEAEKLAAASHPHEEGKR